MSIYLHIWVFPKIMVPPNHPLLTGSSIINHSFWLYPLFLETPISTPWTSLLLKIWWYPMKLEGLDQHSQPRIFPTTILDPQKLVNSSPGPRRNVELVMTTVIKWVHLFGDFDFWNRKLSFSKHHFWGASCETGGGGGYTTWKVPSGRLT